MNGVTIRRSLSLTLIGALAVLLLNTSAPTAPTETDAAGIESYLKLQQDVRDTLQKSFANRHPFVDAKSIGPRETLFDWPKSGEDHLRHILVNRQYDGQYIQKYLIILRIKEAALPPSDARKGVSSDTMEATTVLNHYLSPLKEVGLVCPNSPFAAISNIQYSAKTWVPKSRYEGEITADSPVWVEGEVFYAPNEKVMVVRITIGGRYIPNDS